MCFSSGGGQVKAKPANPLSRFAYNQPVPQQQPHKAPQSPAPEQQAFGSELGSTTPARDY